MPRPRQRCGPEQVRSRRKHRSPATPENRQPDDPAQLDFPQSAYAHIMGRTAYEGISVAMTTSTDHPFAPILNAARKVVFSGPADGRVGQHHHRRR